MFSCKFQEEENFLRNFDFLKSHLVLNSGQSLSFSKHLENMESHLESFLKLNSSVYVVGTLKLHDQFFRKHKKLPGNYN